MNLKFDEENHEYSVVLPSVTQIIRVDEGSIFDDVPEDLTASKWEWIINRATEIGDKTHEAIEYFHKSDDDLLVTEDSSVEPYLEAYAKFYGEHDFACEHSERKMWCRCHLFAGTVDLVGILDGEPAIIDIKTTNELDKEKVELQTRAYQHLYRANTYDSERYKRYALQLTKRSTYNLVECTDDVWPEFERRLKSLRTKEKQNA